MYNNEVEIRLERPFGPRMIVSKLPMHIIDNMNRYCDNVIAQGDMYRKEHDKSQDLVGHVAEELNCDLSEDSFKDLLKILFDACKFLQENDVRERGGMESGQVPGVNLSKLFVAASWFVRSFKNDYNPLHIHTGCDFSCIIYTKVPPSIGRKNFKNTKKNHTTEGYIDFFSGTNTLCSPCQYTRRPEVGDLYVFPASLSHTAYPFYGEGERRSFSANLSLQYDEIA